MALSRRHQFLAEVAARLEAITVANGFNTNAGAALYLGFAPELGENDADDAIAVLIGEDDLDEFQGPSVSYELPIEIEAIAKLTEDTDVEHPWIRVERMIQDIKRAFELDDREFGGTLAWPIDRGSTKTLKREPGSTTVGAGITYLARIKEAWGAP
jgi:hypothetical protein